MNFKKMYAFRKKDLAQFPCGSEDVCRIEQGSTNSFLSEPRALEQFLEAIEPRYTNACEALALNQVTFDAVEVLSGFVAFVIASSPTAMRLGSIPLQHLVHAEAEILDRSGQIDRSPPELGSKTLSELLNEGSVHATVDRKYPQAIGISNVLQVTHSFASFHWEILLNPHFEKSPFLTSDYPAAIEKSVDARIVNRVVPLRPDLAVRIHPQIRPVDRPDLPTDFRYRVRTLSPSEITTANRTIVRSAENLIFSPLDAPWVKTLVRRNSKFRVEIEHTKFPSETGTLLLNRAVLIEQKERPAQ